LHAQHRKVISIAWNWFDLVMRDASGALRVHLLQRQVVFIMWRLTRPQTEELA